MKTLYEKMRQNRPLLRLAAEKLKKSTQKREAMELAGITVGQVAACEFALRCDLGFHIDFEESLKNTGVSVEQWTLYSSHLDR